MTTINSFKKYCFRFKELSYKHLAKKFNLTYIELAEQLCEIWDQFENPHMVDNMIITNYPKQQWYYELVKPKWFGNKKVFDRGKTLPIHFVQDFWLANQKEDQHVSVYAHDRQWVDDYKKFNTVSGCGECLYIPTLWVEIDRKDYFSQHHHDQAMQDGHTLANKFDGSYLFTSGNNSAHVLLNGKLFGSPIISNRNTKVIQLLVSIISGGLRYKEILDNPTYFKTSKLKKLIGKYYPDVDLNHMNQQRAVQALENVDMNIYHPNGLIRQPWSYHEKGGGQKTCAGGTQKLEFTQNLPTNIHLYWKAWDEYEKLKKKFKKKVDIEYDSSYIREVYEPYYPEIMTTQANGKGYVGRFHSIFYSDSNPDVVICLKTGRHIDFGSHRFSMSLEQFKKRAKQL